MIQRIQTLWLFIAAVMGAGLFAFDIYHYTINDIVHHLNVMNNYPLLLLALILVALPLIAIFMFKNRKRQRGMAILSIVINAGFIALMLMQVASINNQTPAPTKGSYWIGAVLPIIAIIFLIMAISGIRKDEKLVKSLDRLR